MHIEAPRGELVCLFSVKSVLSPEGTGQLSLLATVAFLLASWPRSSSNQHIPPNEYTGTSFGRPRWVG